MNEQKEPLSQSVHQLVDMLGWRTLEDMKQTLSDYISECERICGDRPKLYIVLIIYYYCVIAGFI